MAFANNGVTVIANAGETAVELPADLLDAEVLLASGPIEGAVLPADTTVWLAR